MSYLPTSGLTEEQEKALFVEPEELAKLSADTKVDLLIEHERLRVARTDAFWNALQSATTALIPIAASIGLISFLTGRKK